VGASEPRADSLLKVERDLLLARIAAGYGAPVDEVEADMQRLAEVLRRLEAERQLRGGMPTPAKEQPSNQEVARKVLAAMQQPRRQQGPATIAARLDALLGTSRRRGSASARVRPLSGPPRPSMPATSPAAAAAAAAASRRGKAAAVSRRGKATRQIAPAPPPAIASADELPLPPRRAALGRKGGLRRSMLASISAPALGAKMARALRKHFNSSPAATAPE
jgi:hypothetical protein